MCWFKLLLKKLCPLTFDHVKLSGSSFDETYASGVSDNTFSFLSCPGSTRYSFTCPALVSLMFDVEKAPLVAASSSLSVLIFRKESKLVRASTRRKDAQHARSSKNKIERNDDDDDDARMDLLFMSFGILCVRDRVKILEEHTCFFIFFVPA